MSRVAGQAAAHGRLLAAVVVLVGAVAFLGPSAATARNPPNPNDRCSQAGRNTCGTTGIGFYDTYRYGIRWFGDYKNVVAGLGRVFCIDLGYWYPSPSYRYQPEEGPGLQNSAGRSVLLVNRQKIAYAVWVYGRSTTPNRQAAVMLYVHSLMGDARPGEADPRAINPTVASIYGTVARDAARFHGPYRIDGQVAGKLTVGEPADATVRVLSAAGAALPNVTLNLTPTGATGVPTSVATDAQGLAHIPFRPTSHDVSIAVKAAGLASTLPAVYRPATQAAAGNAQRVIAPTSQEVAGTVTATVARSHIAVSTAAAPTRLIVGHVVRDRVTITGATAGWHADVSVTIHGPFASEAETSCGRKAWEGTFAATGPGTYITPVATVASPGWYVFQLGVPGDSANVGVRTRCDDAAERFFAQAAPSLATLVSSDRVAPGTPVYDQLTVGSLAGTTVTAVVSLYGPFSSRTTISCGGTPVWSGAIDLTRNGSYRTESFTPTVPGVYVYRATIASTDLVVGTQGVCGEDTESTLVTATPNVVTHASAQETRPGAQITDRVDVSGSGALILTIDVALFGPFDTRTGIGCGGTPLWTGTVRTTGDGSYTTQPVTVPKAGYYTFRESVAESPTNAAFSGRCGETAETTLASARPTVTTIASAEVVRPGSALSDRILVSGLGQTQAAVQIRLYGPFASRAAIRCTGKPYWQGRVTAQGDGELRSPGVRISSAGFYTFHETLVARPNVAGATTTCADVAETSLGAPGIVTGRGDVTHTVAVGARVPDEPVRVTIASLGIDAPVAAAGIDIRQGVLAVSPDIHKAGWWVDGATQASPSGAIVIAGHVDSARGGAGAFFPLKQARRGAIVELTAADGATARYRVVFVQSMPKAQLPTSIWSQQGPNHLVLVTCGGPFDAASGHYRNNIVVTAVRA